MNTISLIQILYLFTLLFWSHTQNSGEGKGMFSNCQFFFVSVGPVSLSNQVSVKFNTVKMSNTHQTSHQNKAVYAAKLRVYKLPPHTKKWTPRLQQYKVSVYKAASGKRGNLIESKLVTANTTETLYFNVTQATKDWIKMPFLASNGLVVSVSEPNNNVLVNPYYFGLVKLGSVATSAYSYHALYKDFSKRCS